MRIDALALRNFRNYDALNVTFAPDCNVIVGENAQGKTNLLEAIVYLSSARSPRARAEKELISFGKSECSIKANAFARNRDFLLEIALAAGRRRKILINKVPAKKGSDLSDVLGAVYFCPEDLLLIRDGAAARRKFMDDALCQLRARYAQALSDYCNIILDEAHKRAAVNEDPLMAAMEKNKYKGNGGKQTWKKNS